MENNQNEVMSEKEYLSETISQIEVLLSKEMEKTTGSKKDIVSAKKEMWDNAELFTDSIFDRVIAIGQDFEQIGAQITAHDSAVEKIAVLKRMCFNPYFARIDFCEDGEEIEKIYIGRSNIRNEKNYNIYVYDWRAPISSIFYRFELGDAYYDAPMGRIDGKVSLKRQYEIRKGQLNYFFDANISITDEILRKLLSENTSAKMKAIVETIQRNQDMIIRNMDNDLLIVQGVAGSGKTSVALHRVAYLMYQGLVSKLKAGDIIVISPNYLFSQYISDVLLELGETNIETLIFEDLCSTILTPDHLEIQTRNQFFESLITCEDFREKAIMKTSMEFKTSRTFITILERLIEVFAKQMIEFEDIYYDDICLFDKQSMSEFIAKGAVKVPLAARLKTLETVILEKLREKRKERIVKLENQVCEQGEHVLEVAEYARMLSILESGQLLEKIRRFTEIDYLKSYQRLMQDKSLFHQLAAGLTLPEDLEDILNYTLKHTQTESLLYEDGLCLSYLKVRLAGNRIFYPIKQVVIDEAQDYYPIHFEILKLLFVNAKYTILGDVNQTIEKQTNLGIYDEIAQIFNKKKTLLVAMTKSFRCTDEILKFSENFIDYETESESINRHGEPPKVIDFTDLSRNSEKFLSEVKKSREQGYESIGILCKSRKEAQEIYSLFKDKIEIKLIDENNIDTVTGIFVIPVYLAKGLEFDSVFVYGMNPYSKEDEEQKLLYIACTRALHRLVIFNTVH